MLSQAPLLGLAWPGAELGRQQAWFLSNLGFSGTSLMHHMGLLFSECVSGALLDTLDTFLQTHSSGLRLNDLRSMNEHVSLPSFSVGHTHPEAISSPTLPDAILFLVLICLECD